MGCTHVVDHGYGECVEYKPLICWKSTEYCTVDEKGCEFCSCLDPGPDNAGWPPTMQERN